MAMTVQLISGLSAGIEYFEHEEYGFGINVDLGIVRVTWFRDLVFDNNEGDENE